MLAEFLYNLKKNKWLLGLFLICLMVALFDLAIIIFDVVIICLAHKNAATITNSFIPLNVVAAALSVVAIALVIVYVVVASKKGTK